MPTLFKQKVHASITWAQAYTHTYISKYINLTIQQWINRKVQNENYGITKFGVTNAKATTIPPSP